MTDKASNSKTITFKPLQIVNEQRNAYGLKYDDFTRYRKHCANRAHRIRSSLKSTHGKSREFKKPPVVSTDKLKRTHLLLLLFEAERSWGRAQELLALSRKDEAHAHTHRHSATARFRRSVHHTTELLSRCYSLHALGRMPASSVLHAATYTLIMNARFLRYRLAFSDALVQLCVVRGLLDELSARAQSSRDQALAAVWADEVAPEIRYCAHEMGRAKAYDVDGIVSELQKQHRGELVQDCERLLKELEEEARRAAGGESGKKRLDVLLWEGQPVPIRIPELVDVLLKVQEAETKLSLGQAATNQEAEGDKGKVKHGQGVRAKKGVAAYDAVLLALSDAEEVARKLAEVQQSSRTTVVNAGTRDMHFVHAYIVYQLLSCRIQRDLLLMTSLLASETAGANRTIGVKPGKKKQHVDGRLYPAVVKLLDTIFQSLSQMRVLSIVEDSPDLAIAIDGRTSFTRAKKCLYLAQCYVSVKKYAEALTLMQRANIYIRETRSSMSMVPSDANLTSVSFYPLPVREVDELESTLSADASRFKNDWLAYNGGSIDADPKRYKKPLFYDIAFNYVKLDMDKLLQRAGKLPLIAPIPVEKKPLAKAKVEEEVRQATPEPPKVAPARGGLSSLLGGWWGKS